MFFELLDSNTTQRKSKIETKVKDIRTPLREGNISREKAKERLLNYIQDQRQRLETGEISLNSVGRKE